MVKGAFGPCCFMPHGGIYHLNSYIEVSLEQVQPRDPNGRALCPCFVRLGRLVCPLFANGSVVPTRWPIFRPHGRLAVIFYRTDKYYKCSRLINVQHKTVHSSRITKIFHSRYTKRKGCRYIYLLPTWIHICSTKSFCSCMWVFQSRILWWNSMNYANIASPPCSGTTFSPWNSNPWSQRRSGRSSSTIMLCMITQVVITSHIFCVLCSSRISNDAPSRLKNAKGALYIFSNNLTLGRISFSSLLQDWRLSSQE